MRRGLMRMILCEVVMGWDEMGMRVIEHLAELMECCDSIVTHGMQM